MHKISDVQEGMAFEDDGIQGLSPQISSIQIYFFSLGGLFSVPVQIFSSLSLSVIILIALKTYI